MSDSLDLLLNVLLGDNSVSKFERGMGDIEKALEGVDQESLDLADTFANVLDKRLKELDVQFAKSKKQIDGMKQAAEKLGAISQTALVAGTAIVGSFYLSAKREADRIIKAGGEVDEVTKRWIAANERIESSQQKIGRAAEVAIIPLMEKAAVLAEKAANFVESNPDLVSAALNIGLWTAGIGAIGVAVSKGIKLVADIKYLLAMGQFTIDSAIIKNASVKMFEAALLMQKGGSISPGKLSPLSTASTTVAAGGTTAAVTGTTAGTTTAAATTGATAAAATTVIALIIGSIIGKAFGNELTEIIYKEKNVQQSFGDIAQTGYRLASIPSSLLIKLLGDVGVISQSTANQLTGTISSISNWLGSILGATGANDKMAASLFGSTAASNNATKQNLNNANSARSLSAMLAASSAYTTRFKDSLSYLAGGLSNAASMVIQFFQKILSSLKLGSAPSHDYSGYAYKGLYAMAQDGQREYVLSGAATKAAEQMVGGQLNQQALLSGLAGQRGNGMQYVDNASFSNVTVADMRRIRQQSRQEAISVMHEVYKK